MSSNLRRCPTLSPAYGPPTAALGGRAWLLWPEGRQPLRNNVQPRLRLKLSFSASGSSNPQPLAAVHLGQEAPTPVHLSETPVTHGS